MYKLRLYIRDNPFADSNDEIIFFKTLKPKISADLTYYCSQLIYEITKPNSTAEIQKRYVKIALKKLESKKRKNISFHRYYKQNATVLDQIYFLRGHEQLELFSIDLAPSMDPEFHTSHDLKAAEVLAYDLLTTFYKQELTIINKINGGVFETNNNALTECNINWTATKTDLIELIYALKVSGAIDGGTGNINQISQQLSTMFNLDLGNFYKTYAEIKNRSKDRTKFLNKLIKSLQAKLDYDDGM